MTISVALTIPDSKPIIQFLKELNGVITNFGKPSVLEAIDKIWNECNLGNGKE